VNISSSSAPLARVPATDSSSSSIHAIAAKALAGLDALEAMLALDIVIRPHENDLMNALNRVTDAAIGLASNIVSATPERFPDFVPLLDAAAYVDAMSPVAARA
jgi:hypothetical protein